MILRILFLLMALGPLPLTLNAGWLDNVKNYFNGNTLAKPPKVKVLIVHDQPGVVLEVKGKYKINDPHTNEHLTTRFVGKRKFIQAVHDGIKWGEEFPGLFQLVIIPDEKSTTTVVDGIEYTGPIFVYDIGGSISIVNEVSIEDFLSSTLANAYKSDTSKEYLAAVAIAARTATDYLSKNPKSPYFAVDGRAAGYEGKAVINNDSEIEQAIHDTRYMVMTTAVPGETSLNTFPAYWTAPQGLTAQGQEVLSKISQVDAMNMAKKGDNAAQILGKAFPGTTIELIHYEKEKN